MTNSIAERLKPKGKVLRFAVAFSAVILALQSSRAQVLTILHTFTDGKDGGYPYAGLVLDKAGNLYGTTAVGGAYGNGTIFELRSTGEEIVLHGFKGPDGATPYARLVRDAVGNLYGTASGGGISNYGTVFKLSKTRSIAVLHKFRGGTTDGCYPRGGLLRDSAGNLYGTTWKCGTAGLGTAFKIDTNGTYTVLHNFAGGPTDGASPSFGSLIMDKAGNFYGVTSDGGSFPAGTVFRMSPDGTVTILHSFSVGASDGCYAYGTPAMDKAGNLYGTTESCGSSAYGIVWKVSQDGTETVLHNFIDSDGGYPASGVILDGRGNLYGNTQNGGTHNDGAVYRMTKRGRITLLYSFFGPDGQYPFGSLIRDNYGNLFGTSLQGGSAGVGTAWKIAP